MRRRQKRVIRRTSILLGVITRYLRIRETIPEMFWRAFVLLIGSSLLAAIAVVITFSTTTSLTAAGVTASILALLLFCPPDAILLRQQRICAQVNASAINEHQNVDAQLDVAHRRYETVRGRFTQARQARVSSPASEPQQPGSTPEGESSA